MQNLKFLANQLSEKINFWAKNEETYNKIGLETEFERGQKNAYIKCLEMVDKLIACSEH